MSVNADWLLSKVCESIANISAVDAEMDVLFSSVADNGMHVEMTTGHKFNSLEWEMRNYTRVFEEMNSRISEFGATASRTVCVRIR